MSANKTFVITPKGRLVYPKLAKPDFGPKDYPIEHGQYTSDVVVPLEDAQKLIDTVQEVATQRLGKKLSKKDVPWDYLEDNDGNPTGEIKIRLRAKNRMRKDGGLWDRKPALIDASKTPVEGLDPGGGTIARVKAEVYPWPNGKGITLVPVVVQIIELVEKDDGTADLSDFDEEDGFAVNTSEDDEDF